jgi:four helix bundle protein
MPASYRQLLVWQKAYELTKDVYGISAALPGEEKYGLVSQLRRSAVSIPSNISEGQQRESGKEFKNFLSIARGSAAELHTQLLLVKDIYSLDTSGLIRETEVIQKMLYSLMRKAA